LLIQIVNKKKDLANSKLISKVSQAHGLIGGGLHGRPLDILSKLSIILLALGHPECSSSLTDTGPILKREWHSKNAVRLKECSLNASRSILRVSVVYLPIFAQNLMQTRCSIFPSITAKTKHKVEKALV
jgi:hypothetical protein